MENLFDKKITHFELCKKTAEWALYKFRFHVALFEYQTLISNEHPDVLLYKDYSILFEIKLSRQDFLSDLKKECRIEKEIKYFTRFNRNRLNKINGINWEKLGMENLVIQAPHLGLYRYYVCPKGLINADEVPNNWGLYWYDENFKLKKESKTFKRDLYKENQLLAHAFRKYASGNIDNIFINKF